MGKSFHLIYSEFREKGIRMNSFGHFDEKDDGYYYGRSKCNHIRYASCGKVYAMRGRERDRQKGKERRPHDLVGSLLSLIDVSQLIF